MRDSQQQLFKQWLRFLLLINRETESKELLSNYFFNHFAYSPSNFYKFILYVKKYLLQNTRDKKHKEIAAKYLSILSPLCERFGLFKEKHLLDDLCFQICHPKQYSAIDALLAGYKNKSTAIINRVIEMLKNTFEEKKYECDAKGRYKNLYSIYCKLQKKERHNALTLNDIFAFRIITKRNTPRICFEIVSILHDKFLPIVDFFKDYITIPKINGYQSLHTGLNNILPELDLPIEVQIRTQLMDDFAERGLAAHWVYAKTKHSKLLTEKEKKLVNYLTTISRQAENSKMVYFFSYKGDMLTMTVGSSVLDFAYHIHTELGHRMNYALVNGRKKALSYRIREGDLVQIITGKKPHVLTKWHTYVSTDSARKKIQNYLTHHAHTTSN